ncbi:phosphate ABC transporter substrate-binding protein PstS [Paraburkholderia ginsengisoli]|uniref:Phosphate-binding protein PstS n=1 Tax=Paraburkholderia ginsengisoli TaxID=311231 RepID=A0A7T4T870_9BURK|nr:phosphate ABC transporter substrate-binding protein PstS [Paraburkholderia ginsengisoli]QQC63140.1 phosphate ABC transporter substrate-binding protein PstS [Paraburkholderia ginsengisoli]
MSKQLVQCLASAVVAAAFASTAFAADITGAGSTFVYPVLWKWAADYNHESGNKVNYESIGSGAGIAKIKDATVDFGATDMPMSSKDLKKAALGQFPTVIGGVVPVVNIEGVMPGNIRFTGPLLADIYLGKIKTWSDPAITKINPGLKLPDANITVVHRSDGSGTTFNWVNYLSKVSPEWKSKVGEGLAVAWPVGIGGNGNEGVATYVNHVKNSIGFVEYAYVLQNKMTYGSIQNKAGNFIEPSAKSFQAAAATADWTKAEDFDLVMTDATGPEAYPVTAATFVVLYKQPKNGTQSKATVDFFKWALEKGQLQAQSLGYVPLPDALVKQIEFYWSTNFKF